MTEPEHDVSDFCVSCGELLSVHPIRVAGSRTIRCVGRSRLPGALGDRRKDLWLRAVRQPGYVDDAKRRLEPITDPAVPPDQIVAYERRVARRDHHLAYTVPGVIYLTKAAIVVGCLVVLINWTTGPLSTPLLTVTLAILAALYVANLWVGRVKKPLPAADWDQVDLVDLREDSRNMLIYAHEAADIARAFAPRAPGVTVGEVDRAVTEDVWRTATLLRDGDAEARDGRPPGNIASYRLARHTIEALMALAEQILAKVETDVEQADTDAAAEQAAARAARLAEASGSQPASDYLATILTHPDKPAGATS